MLAYDYPLLGLFWTIFMIFIWVAWLMLLFRVFIDIFRSDDMGGWGKAAWSLLVLFLPLLGVLIYVIARGDGMTKRDIQVAQEQEAAFRSYVQETAGSGGASAADELNKLAGLRDSGVINEAEFDAQKAKLLA